MHTLSYRTKTTEMIAHGERNCRSRGQSDELGARKTEQFPHLGNYAL